MTRGKFIPGEKVSINGRIGNIVNRHHYKKHIWYVRITEEKGFWFDEQDITKIEQPKPITNNPKNQAEDSSAEIRQKHPKKGVRRDFLMLEE